jgi:hypothetical protein
MGGESARITVLKRYLVAGLRTSGDPDDPGGSEKGASRAPFPAYIY